MAFTIPDEDRQSFLQWYKTAQSGAVPRTIGSYSPTSSWGNMEDLKTLFGGRSSSLSDWYQKWKKSKDTEAPAASKTFVANTRVATPVVAVPTSSPAYAKGGMVRGCGKAVKGRGKVKVY